MKVNGITFYSTPEACIESYERNCCIVKICSFIKSCFTLIAFVFQNLRRGDHSYPEPQFNQRRLIVCIHGLNDQPDQFAPIVAQLGNLQDTDLYIPAVRKRGNDELDAMAQDIFEKIRNSQAQELVLIGISNGARIACAIEAQLLKNAGSLSKIKLISIVGACQGSSLAALAHKLSLAWMMSRPISKEMPAGSDRNKRLVEDLNVSSSLQREHVFIASPHDWQVPNYDSTLMKKQADAKYAIIPGHGHCSIVPGVAEIVAQLV